MSRVAFEPLRAESASQELRRLWRDEAYIFCISPSKRALHFSQSKGPNSFGQNLGTFLIFLKSVHNVQEYVYIYSIFIHVAMQYA